MHLGPHQSPPMTDPNRHLVIAENVLGTEVCPTEFREAAERHGRHFARYLFAARFARSKRVLDGACGSGYGAAYLATLADFVLGVDLDDKLLHHARSAFAKPNLEFRKHDLHIPVQRDGPFGLITTFETLEHVGDPRRCLAALAEALADGGTLLASVPNGEKELLRGRHKRYHPRQFSAADFEGLLREQFDDVQLFSQVYRKGAGHYLRKLSFRTNHPARGYHFHSGLDDGAKTWLAVCRRGTS
ncbi:MAG: class I SAM-dependent methyltransferase [Planctomycetota bacterium]